jgi:hypothetical protein
LCESNLASNPLEHGKTTGSYLKLKKDEDIPPNFFCIKKVETHNGAMLKNDFEELRRDRKHLGEDLEQFAMKLETKE